MVTRGGGPARLPNFMGETDVIKDVNLSYFSWCFQLKPLADIYEDSKRMRVRHD